MVCFQLGKNQIIVNALAVADKATMERLRLVPAVPGLWIGDTYPVQYTESELVQQMITDLELSDLEQGQTITDLELMILGGTQNV